MSKILTFIFILFFAYQVNAQYEYATLILKDGTELKGQLKRRNFASSIKFKKNYNSEPTVYETKELIGYNIDKTQYRFIVPNFNYTPVLTTLEKEGYYNLYKSTINYTSVAPAAGGFGGAGMGMSGTAIIYYISGPQGVFKLGKRLGNKKLKKYFNDCPDLLTKIKKKEIKKSQVKNIVEFYNTKCKSS